MTSIEIARSFDQLERLLRRPEAPREPVILTKDGVAYAAVVPVDATIDAAGPDAETRATWASASFQEILARSREDRDAGREQSLEEVARDLRLVVGAAPE
jgi:antitoxin (DNA-binding transcriptional repressor) of toxin-antitoxin stability system